jgi:L-amino acid N-acyltransferase YncA
MLRMRAEVRARPFEARDAARVAEIYNQGIAERGATFETEPRTAENIARQFAERSSTHPAVVVERNGQVVAAAWSSEYRPRQAYAGVGEVSVYVAAEARGHGIGLLAMRALMGAAEQKGFWKLVSRVFPENVASRRLCAAAGFREVGIYRRHARLDGQWRDCIIVECLLGAAAPD